MSADSSSPSPCAVSPLGKPTRAIFSAVVHQETTTLRLEDLQLRETRLEMTDDGVCIAVGQTRRRIPFAAFDVLASPDGLPQAFCIMTRESVPFLLQDDEMLVVVTPSDLDAASWARNISLARCRSWRSEPSSEDSSVPMPAMRDAKLRLRMVRQHTKPELDSMESQLFTSLAKDELVDDDAEEDSGVSPAMARQNIHKSLRRTAMTLNRRKKGHRRRSISDTSSKLVWTKSVDDTSGSTTPERRQEPDEDEREESSYSPSTLAGETEDTHATYDDSSVSERRGSIDSIGGDDDSVRGPPPRAYRHSHKSSRRRASRTSTFLSRRRKKGTRRSILVRRKRSSSALATSGSLRAAQQALDEIEVARSGPANSGRPDGPVTTMSFKNMNAGTVKELLFALVDPAYGSEFVDVFLTTMTYWMQPRDLLRYLELVGPKLMGSQRKHLLTVCTLWLRLHFYYFERCPYLFVPLKAFCVRIFSKSNLSIIRAAMSHHDKVITLMHVPAEDAVRPPARAARLREQSSELRSFFPLVVSRLTMKPQRMLDGSSQEVFHGTNLVNAVVHSLGMEDDRASGVEFATSLMNRGWLATATRSSNESSPRSTMVDTDAAWYTVTPMGQSLLQLTRLTPSRSGDIVPAREPPAEPLFAAATVRHHLFPQMAEFMRGEQPKQCTGAMIIDWILEHTDIMCREDAVQVGDFMLHERLLVGVNPTIDGFKDSPDSTYAVVVKEDTATASVGDESCSETGIRASEDDHSEASFSTPVNSPPTSPCGSGATTPRTAPASPQPPPHRDHSGDSSPMSRHTPEAIFNPELTRMRMLNMLVLDPLEVARQLTMSDWLAFQRLGPSSLLHEAWSNKNRAKAKAARKAAADGDDNFEDSDSQEDGPNMDPITILLRRSSLSYWVASEVLSWPGGQAAQANVLKRFIAVAAHLLKLRNFHSLFCLSLGLQLNPLTRCKELWSQLPSKYESGMKLFRALTNPAGNYAHYRKLLCSDVESPTIPYLGLFLKDLTFIEENPSLLEKGVVNFGKMKLLYGVVAVMRKHQEHAYHFEVVPAIRKYLRNDILLLTDDQLYNLSYKHQES